MFKKKISLFSLVLLIIAAIDSIRNLPAAALFGSHLIFFFVLSALVFLIPTSLVAAELASRFPQAGGVYHWVSQAFGRKWGMMAIWLQWINTIIWYPTILSFIAGTVAYLINPELVNQKAYMALFILAAFWLMTLLNLKGINFSARLNSCCVVIGTVIPMLVLIALGIVWVCTGKHLEISFSPKELIPNLDSGGNWVALIAIMASFLGIELSGVHVGDIREPQRNFPKAVFISVFFILATMLLGSLAIAVVIPQKEINLVSGVVQVFAAFMAVFGIKGVGPLLSVLIIVGSMGGLINWLLSPAKGLLQASEFGFLPPFFKKLNSGGVPARILLMQAALVSVLCLLLLLVPSINGFYWFLTALSTELYMVMYLLMFFAAFVLRVREGKVARTRGFAIPGGRLLGIGIICLLGLFGCLSTIIVSFLPPDNINVGSSTFYVLMIVAGNILAIAPVGFFIFYRKLKMKR